MMNNMQVGQAQGCKSITWEGIWEWLLMIMKILENSTECLNKETEQVQKETKAIICTGVVLQPLTNQD